MITKKNGIITCDRRCSTDTNHYAVGSKKKLREKKINCKRHTKKKKVINESFLVERVVSTSSKYVVL